MTDEFVLRKEGMIAVIDGRRSGAERRSGEERRRVGQVGMESSGFVLRALVRRTSEIDRRVGYRMSKVESFRERVGIVVLGMTILFIGIALVVMGITFLPVAGFVIGLGVFNLGFFFLFRRNPDGTIRLFQP